MMLNEIHLARYHLGSFLQPCRLREELDYREDFLHFNIFYNIVLLSPDLFCWLIDIEHYFISRDNGGGILGISIVLEDEAAYVAFGLTYASAIERLQKDKPF